MGSAAISEGLGRTRFSHVSEVDLHEQIASTLDNLGIDYRREVQIGNGRIDFLAGGIGIEVKIKGGIGEVTRQLHRYAQSPLIDELLLVSTRSQHRNMPETMNSKPVGVVYLCPL